MTGQSASCRRKLRGHHLWTREGMPLRRAAVTSTAAAMLTLACGDANAFKLKPTGTDDERLIVQLEDSWFGGFLSRATRTIMKHFTDGVHEEITHRIWGCTPPAGADPRDDTSCAPPHPLTAAPPAVVYGVQWNDNPPFKLDATNDKACTTNQPIRLPDRQPNCWRKLFTDATKRARTSDFNQANGTALIYRAHFGDLQFTHAMASKHGETMRQTKAGIMMWAEFTYRVAIGEIHPRTVLSQVGVTGFKEVLGRYWGDVSTLFTYGVPQHRDSIADVAFGSLLHMVQDSFSNSHVKREAPVGICADGDPPRAGRVLSFNDYSSQDPDKHGEEDARGKMRAQLLEQRRDNVVGVARHLKSLRDQRAPWESMRQYLDRCVFAIDPGDLDKPAGAGGF